MITIKILCHCGTKFAFEADESITLAAESIKCPNCGADASEAANTQLATARTSSAAPVTPEPSRRVRLAIDPPGGKPTQQDESETAEDEPAPARRRMPYAQSHGPSRSERMIRQNREQTARRKPYVIAVVLLLVLVSAFWIWYRVTGSKPKVVMNHEYDRAERPLVPRLLPNQEMLLIRNRDVSLLSDPTGKPIWQTSIGNVTNFDDSTPNYAELDYRVERATPAVRIASNSFWIVWPDKIVDLKRDSGELATSIDLPDAPQEIAVGERLLVVEQPTTNKSELAFEILPLAGGEKQSIQVDLLTNAPPPKIIPDAASVVVMQTRLLESRMITNKLSTGPKVMTASGIKKSPNDNFDKILEGTHTAGQSLSASVKLVHELNRRDDDEPDETYEDQSRYEVEIRRAFGGGSTWKGEIIGPPRFYPLPSVDVVAGEKHFKVIDKNGQLKWESPLSYPLSERAVSSANFYRPFADPLERPLQHDDTYGLRYRFPFVEHENQLYAYDSGVLACFDLASGDVKWRVTSVGIRKIIFDRDGFLYACTTQDGAQTLQKPNPDRSDAPVDEIIKIDPKSGSVLWHAPYLGTDLYVSGKFIYSKWVGENILNQAAALAARADAVPSCAITRINPSNGEVLWRREFKGDPDTVNIQQNWLLIQYPRQIEVLKFFSL